MTRPLEVALIGAGNRGYEAYGPYALAHPDELRFVAVAEPAEQRRRRFAAAHGIPAERQYARWEDLLNSSSPRADALLICTLDCDHFSPTYAGLTAGYDILLEKPMATTRDDCVALVGAAERTGALLQLCHVLRYTAFFARLHDIVSSGRLGRIIMVEHRENVSYWHMAHSYVRGNWRSSAAQCPMILAKCCHDLDIITWNLGGCHALSSFGSLLHFRPENAPPGAPEYCLDGCPAASDCPWYAPRLYVDLVPLLRVARESSDLWPKVGASLLLNHPRLTQTLRRALPRLAAALDYRGWPVSVIAEETDVASRRAALERGPYGRCVYRCDNDVVDHQVVAMQMESGTSAVLVMQGHSDREERTMRYDGTRATLHGWYGLGGQGLSIRDHLTGKAEHIHFRSGLDAATGHAGGDWGVLAAFVRAVRDRSEVLTTAREALESHLLAFAAENARLNREAVAMEAWRQTAPHDGSAC